MIHRCGGRLNGPRHSCRVKIITQIEIFLKVCSTSAPFVSVEVRFYVRNLYVRFPRIQSVRVHRIGIFDNRNAIFAETFGIKILNFNNNKNVLDEIKKNKNDLPFDTCNGQAGHGTCKRPNISESFVSVGSLYTNSSPSRPSGPKNLAP